MKENLEGFSGPEPSSLINEYDSKEA